MAENSKKKIRKNIFLFCIALCLCCFLAHYFLMAGCKPDETGMVYAFCEDDVLRYFVESFLPQVGNSGLVFSLLWYFGWPALVEMVANRKKTIDKDIIESTAIKEAAEKSSIETAKKMSSLPADMEAIERGFEETAKEESTRIREEAKLQAERIKEDAAVSFELQANVAKRAFQAEIMSSAIDNARKEIISQLAADSSLRDKLIDQSIASLEF